MGFQIAYKVPVAALWLVQRMIDQNQFENPSE